MRLCPAGAQNITSQSTDNVARLAGGLHVVHPAEIQSTISYHVKILSHADLVSVRREGKFFFYRLHKDVLDYYAPNLLDHLQVDVPGATTA